MSARISLRERVAAVEGGARVVERALPGPRQLSREVRRARNNGIPWPFVGRWVWATVTGDTARREALAKEAEFFRGQSPPRLWFRLLLSPREVADSFLLTREQIRRISSVRWFGLRRFDQRTVIRTVESYGYRRLVDKAIADERRRFYARSQPVVAIAALLGFVKAVCP